MKKNFTRFHFYPSVAKNGKLILICFQIALVGLLVYVVFQIPRVLTITTIVCRSQFGLCPPETAALFDSLISLPIYKVDNSLISAKAGNLRVINVRKKFPSYLEVEVELPKPVARLIFADNSLPEVLVSNRGQVLGLHAGQALPQIFTDITGAPSQGEIVKDLATYKSVELVAHLSNFATPDLQIHIRGDTLEIKNLTSGTVLSSSHADPAATAATLQQLLSTDKISDNRPSRIDLRFTQPIITF